MSRDLPPLRIVTLIDHLAGGGAERAAVEVARRLAEHHEVLLVGSREARDGAAATALRDEGLRVLTLQRTSVRRVSEWAPLVREMRRRPVDVLHTHLTGSNAWGPLLRTLGGAAVLVAHEHGSVLQPGDRRRWSVPAVTNPWIVGPGADRVLVPSAWSRDVLTTQERVPPRKVRVVPNGADPAPADQPGVRAQVRAQVRAALGVAPDETAIVITAMLRAEKGHETALRAIALLTDAFPRLRLLLVGDGPVHDPQGTRPVLERLVGDLGIGQVVTFLGLRDDVSAVLAASDVAVLPSDRENLPLALLEHMSAGLPIVATAVGGVPDAITDGVHGLLVPPGDPEAMAAALHRTLVDPDAARARGAAARERQAATYTWDAVAASVERVYRDARAQRGGRRAREQHP